MLSRHPILPVLSDHPYLSTNWTLRKRVETVRGHYRAVCEHGLDILVFPSDSQVTVAQLDEVMPGLRVVLDKPYWFVHEGEVAINLFKGERRLYSLLFTLARQENKSGHLMAYVGALQGVSGAEMPEIYRDLTHAAHGMRPRDLLFAAFRMLCRPMGVQHIEAVSDSCSMRRSTYFARVSVVTVDHDLIWQEYGGELQPNGFFRIDAKLQYRDPQDIPSRKRAQYRRRYGMLQELDARIEEGVDGKSVLSVSHGLTSHMAIPTHTFTSPHV